MHGAGDLELFTVSFEFEVEGWRSIPVISLRDAAKLQAPWNTFTKNRCAYLQVRRMQPKAMLLYTKQH